MDSFDNMMKAACHIKTHQMSFDKKIFEKLPEFYKTGLYCWDMLKHVHSQKEFKVKKAAFEVHKEKGIRLINEENYDEAHYSFCKALCIFKYITNTNKNWKNEGVKDEQLTFCEDEGNNNEDKEEIQKLKISALLNIALCDLNAKKYEEVRHACDEVLKLDPNNLKAYYRKAKSYLDCKSSVHADYLTALEELEKALKVAPDDKTINKIYNSLKSQIDMHNKDEKKVFKSFFRDVNVYKKENNIEKAIEEGLMPENKSDLANIEKIDDDDPNLGKSEMRILDLVIEQCYVMIGRLEREGNKIELDKLKIVAEKATYYKEDLKRLLELNFENPNEELRKFADKQKLNLQDLNVKKEFFRIRKNYLDQINKFYEENLLKTTPKDLLSSNTQINKTKILAKPKNSVNNKNTETVFNNKCDTIKKRSVRKLKIYYGIISLIIIFLGVVFYSVFKTNFVISP